jgi:hypothetical protein
VITAGDILTTSGRHPERLAWVSPAVEANAGVLAAKVDALLLLFGESRKVTGGFRDMLTNRRLKNASPYSRHQTGEAVDLEDTMGRLKAWAKTHPEAFEQVGLWCEPFHLTPTWLHVQSTPVPSGLRVSL